MQCPYCKETMRCTVGEGHEMWQCSPCGYKHSRYVKPLAYAVGGERKFINSSRVSTPAGSMSALVEKCKAAGRYHESCIVCDRVSTLTVPQCCNRVMTSCTDGHVCDVCERFRHRNGNRTPDEWWKQTSALIASGGPFVVDPLDVRIDGMTMRDLLAWDELLRREQEGSLNRLWSTAAQRAALSAHWSAELRAKITAGAARERLQVVLEHDVGDESW